MKHLIWIAILAAGISYNLAQQAPILIAAWDQPNKTNVVGFALDYWSALGTDTVMVAVLPSDTNITYSARMTNAKFGASYKMQVKSFNPNFILSDPATQSFRLLKITAQSAPNVTGPWTTRATNWLVISPYGQTTEFFRVRLDWQ